MSMARQDLHLIQANSNETFVSFVDNVLLFLLGLIHRMKAWISRTMLIA